jgi:hypothetical protein
MAVDVQVVSNIPFIYYILHRNSRQQPQAVGQIGERTYEALIIRKRKRSKIITSLIYYYHYITADSKRFLNPDRLSSSECITLTIQLSSVAHLSPRIVKEA